MNKKKLNLKPESKNLRIYNNKWRWTNKNITKKEKKHFSSFHFTISLNQNRPIDSQLVSNHKSAPTVQIVKQTRYKCCMDMFKLCICMYVHLCMNILIHMNSYLLCSRIPLIRYGGMTKRLQVFPWKKHTIRVYNCADWIPLN